VCQALFIFTDKIFDHYNKIPKLDIAGITSPTGMPDKSPLIPLNKIKTWYMGSNSTSAANSGKEDPTSPASVETAASMASVDSTTFVGKMSARLAIPGILIFFCFLFYNKNKHTQ
jgi:hypothetical protein